MTAVLTVIAQDFSTHVGRKGALHALEVCVLTLKSQQAFFSTLQLFSTLHQFQRKQKD